MHHYPSMFGHPKEDSVAGVVVFLVALPLCLGIAIACGVPPVSGLVAGVVGGMVVPWISPLAALGHGTGRGPDLDRPRRGQQGRPRRLPDGRR